MIKAVLLGAALTLSLPSLTARAAEDCSILPIAFARPHLPSFFHGKRREPSQTMIQIYESPSRPRPDPKLVAERRAIIRKARAPAAVLSGTQLITSPSLKSYAAGIVHRLLKGFKGPAPDPAVRVEITADRYGNAEAGYDNTVYVPATLIQSVRNEDQLAFVLGHELGHILKMDFLSTGFLDQQKSIADRMANASVAGAAVASMRLKRSANGQFMLTNPNEKEVTKTARSASLGFLVAQEVSDTLIAPGWTLAEENAADKFGVDLMVRAGYNPEAAEDVFDLIASRNCRSIQAFDQIDGNWFQNVGTSVLSLVQVNANGVSLNKNVAEKTLTRYGRDLLKSAALDVRSMRQNSTHASAKKRAEQIDKYIGEHYADVPLRETRVAALRRVQKSSVDKALFLRIGNAHEARDELVKGDLTSASKKLNSFISDDDSFFKYTGYQVRRAEFEAGQGQKRYTEAMEDLTQAANSPTATPAVYSALAVELANEGRGTEAMKRIAQAQRRFGSDSTFWPVTITVQEKIGQRSQAQTTLATCNSKGGRKIQVLCQNAYSQATQPSTPAAAKQDSGQSLQKEATDKVKGVSTFLQNKLNPNQLFNHNGN